MYSKPDKLTVDFNYPPFPQLVDSRRICSISSSSIDPSNFSPSKNPFCAEQLDVLRARRTPTKITHVCSQEHIELPNLWGWGKHLKPMKLNILRVDECSWKCPCKSDLFSDDEASWDLPRSYAMTFFSSYSGKEMATFFESNSQL